MSGGAVNLINSNVLRNEADYGGGLRVSGGVLNISGSRIDMNMACATLVLNP